jgi:hypothetical protein
MFEALGAAAFTTASYTFVVEVFPDNMGTVWVRLSLNMNIHIIYLPT